MLVVATVGAGAWWFLLRGDAAPVTGNFARQEQRFAAAARAVPESAGQVTSVTGLRRWNTEVQVHLDEMDLAYAEMVQIQNLAVDDAARIIGEAVPTAAEVIDLTGDYRDQFNEGALTTAASAADAIEALLTKLDARARAWKKL